MLARADLSARPPIYVAEADYDELSRLAADVASPGAALLGQELERATVVRDGEGPPVFVRLGSRVEFKDLMSERVHTVTLVGPAEADMEAQPAARSSPRRAPPWWASAPATCFNWTVDGRPRLLVVNRVALVGRRRDLGARFLLGEAGAGQQALQPAVSLVAGVFVDLAVRGAELVLAAPGLGIGVRVLRP